MIRRTRAVWRFPRPEFEQENGLNSEYKCLMHSKPQGAGPGVLVDPMSIKLRLIRLHTGILHIFLRQ